MIALPETKFPKRLSGLLFFAWATLLAGCAETPWTQEGDIVANLENVHTSDGAQSEQSAEAERAEPSPIVAQTEPSKFMVLHAPVRVLEATTQFVEPVRESIIKAFAESGFSHAAAIDYPKFEQSLNAHNNLTADQIFLDHAQDYEPRYLVLFDIEVNSANKHRALAALRAKTFDVPTGRLISITEKFAEIPWSQSALNADETLASAALETAREASAVMIRAAKRNDEIGRPEEFRLVFLGFSENEMDGIFEIVSAMDFHEIKEVEFEAGRMDVIALHSGSAIALRREIRNTFRRIYFPMETVLIDDHEIHFRAVQEN
ncbi:MAG: hypothetical protein G3M78_14235 [Candidatus Nitrohelix vancouverensis]|uniref:Uncharacterized protein n=1 Tax=Candidatus Nitrohelix vancouverensis TaxID=2705534 RepID=A0A7T0C4S1_9BACT|nr:MAG: hypothetical protein G3M78_14235 [Candidatus Nitrohelix vancouverensis]